jgi:hypothetical protein
MENGTDLRQSTRDWIQEEADRHYGGSWVAAAAAMLESLHEAAQAPEDPWAYLSARQQRRSSAT